MCVWQTSVMARGHELAHVDIQGMRRHVISVDSRFREEWAHTTPSEYQFRLPTALRAVKISRLLTTEIPNTQYSVNATNNKIDFEHKFTALLPDAEQTCTATLAVGTFSGTEMASQIDIAMNAALTPPRNPGERYTVQYDPQTQKVIIRRVVGGEFALLWGSGANRSKSAAAILGFDETADTGLATEHRSWYIINLSGDNMVYLCIKNLGSVQTAMVSDVFAKIVWDQPPRSTCFDSFVSNAVVWNEPLNSLDRFDIKFCQPDGSLYDFNNMEHSFSVEVYTLA